MIWRWLWRTLAFFVGRRLWEAWQRRQNKEPTYRTPPRSPRGSRR